MASGHTGNGAATPETLEDNGDFQERAAPRAAGSAENGSSEVELAAVVDAWPSLPEPIKAGILAMVEAWLKGGDHE